MRKLITLFALVFTMVLFVNCTDNSLEDLKQNEQQTEEHIKFDGFSCTEPEDDGTIEGGDRDD